MRSLNEVLKDIENLVGLKLESIRTGSEITLNKIDWSTERIIITTSNGLLKSRPFIEIERLWTALCTKPAIHVDSVLGGSGSSRNQPETILSNLPYIEWLMIAGKKHLCLVNSITHKFGTLKKMDPIAAEELRGNIINFENKIISNGSHVIIVISEDLYKHSLMIESSLGVQGVAIKQGIYKFNFYGIQLLIISSLIISDALPAGTYFVFENTPPNQKFKSIEIDGKQYAYPIDVGLKVLYTL